MKWYLWNWAILRELFDCNYSRNYFVCAFVIIVYRSVSFLCYQEYDCSNLILKSYDDEDLSSTHCSTCWWLSQELSSFTNTTSVCRTLLPEKTRKLFFYDCINKKRSIHLNVHLVKYRLMMLKLFYCPVCLD